MSLCGRAARDATMPLPIERLLQAVTLGDARADGTWRAAGVRLGVGDDATRATDPRGSAVILDGRLHDRPALHAALGPAECDGHDDAALALAAYHRWGADFADRLTGDFSCAVWDGTTRELLLVTDPGGMRPLHYWHRDGDIRFATDARALLAEHEIDDEIDEARVARWLCLAVGLPGQTFFRNIHRVPPGSLVRWRDGTMHITRWWRPESLPTLRMSNDKDYVDALRDTFARAVRDRLDRDCGIGSHLSGGLDSSAVTSFAAQALARDGRRLAAFTAAPDHDVPQSASRFGDEWQHAAAVAARYPNIDHVRIPNDGQPLFAVIDRRHEVLGTPIFNPANTVWMDGIERAARDRGVSVLLTGQMGNLTLSHAGSELFGLQVRQRRPVAALRTLLARHRRGDISWRGAAAISAAAVLPPRWRRRLRALAGAPGSDLSVQTAVRSEFLERHALGDALAAGNDRLIDAFRDDSRALRIAAFEQSEFRGDYARATRRLYGIDLRDPTQDRRVMELCLSLPLEQFALDGVPRSLARRLLADHVPPEVVHERRRGLQSADWAVSFDTALPELKAEVARLRVSPAVSEWIDLDRIARALDRWPGPGGGPSAQEYNLATGRAITLGRFIRRFHGDDG